MVRTKLTRRQMLKYSFLGGVGACMGNGFLREPFDVRLEQVKIPIADLGPEFDGYRIALLSDFHVPAKSSLNLVRHAFELAKSFKPDLIALTGDFVHNRESGVPDFEPYFGDVTAPDGVFGVLGNHDHWVDAYLVRKRLGEGTHVQILDNEHRILHRGNARLAIAGVDDLWCGKVRTGRALGSINPDVPRVLLAHNPDFALDMSDDFRVDLQLSGHTHGGEVRIPFGPAPVLPSKYGQRFRDGLCFGKHRVYVNRGICSVSRARFCCPPEVTAITLVQ